MINLRQAVILAAFEQQLDKAIYPIQTILGQDDGGVAGLYFSRWEDPEYFWEKATQAERLKATINYVKFEIAYMDLGDQENV